MTTNFRKLVYVPILHVREDSEQAASVRSLPRTLLRGENEKSGAKDVKFNADHSAVGEMWADITTKITEFAFPWNKMRIYQDGLPVCGEELKIVTRLAKKDNWNHLLILNLLQKGAKLEGTENMDFLMREYDLLNVLLMKNSDAEQAAAMAEYQAKSRELLKLRDEFIFSRIKTTLQEGEVGIVFMGVMHRLDKLLEKYCLVSYVIYRLPFRNVEAIYNA